MIHQLLKTSALFLTLSVSLNLSAQDHLLRKLVDGPAPDCDTLEISILSDITELDFFNDEDSIIYLLQVLEDNCGYSESMHRIHLLYNINNNTLDSADIQPYYKDFTEVYLDKLSDLNTPVGYIVKEDQPVFLVRRNLLKWTQSVADSILLRDDNTPEDEFFLILYSSESYYDKKRSWYKNTDLETVPLAQEYREKAYQEETGDLRFTIEAGAWLPYGNLNQYLGGTGLAGFEFGGFDKQFGVGVGTQLRIPNNKQKIDVKDIDSSAMAKANFGATVYCNLYLGLVNNRNFNLNIVAGIGADILFTDAVKGIDEEGFEYTRNIHSFDFISGVELSGAVEGFDRAGVRLLHHVVDYTNDKALYSPLHGNFVTLTVFYRF